jgi:hypothetical protein
MSTLPTEPSDSQPLEPSYGHGGVPWYLLALYLGFLVFFTWYTLEHQLPDFLNQGPVQEQGSEQVEAGK